MDKQLKNKLINEVFDKFFEGQDYFGDYRELGHLWVAKHGSREMPSKELIKFEPRPSVMRFTNCRQTAVIHEFETLTIEPPTGGQYEVAVRIFSEGEWRGYKVADTETMYLLGVETRGH